MVWHRTYDRFYEVHPDRLIREVPTTPPPTSPPADGEEEEEEIVYSEDGTLIVYILGKNRMSHMYTYPELEHLAYLGEDVKSGNISELRFRLHLWDFTHNDDIDVKLNNDPLKELKPAGPTQTPSAGQWLECRLDPAQVTRGENRVELMVRKRDESMQTPLVLDAVQLHVHHKG